MYLVLALGLSLVWAGWLPNTVHFGGFLAHMFYYTNYYMIFGPPHTGMVPGLESLWSLAVEEHFYLLFPCAYILLRRSFRRPKDQFLVLGAIWLLISAWRCTLVLGWNEE